MVEWHDTIVIGGGQAGLVMSHCLSDRGREHVVLERHRLAERWRNERWDSLYFQFTNEFLELAGHRLPGLDPDAFAHHPMVLQLLRSYADRIAAPLREHTEVVKLYQDGASPNYILATPTGLLGARHVVIATGPFQTPYIPDFSAKVPPSVFQVHAAQYKNPTQLPAGGVLIVGSGASGCQIAEDLRSADRRVFLSVSRHRRVPRRFRSKDCLWWFEKLGRFEVTIDSFPGRRYPPSTVVTGVNGGYDMDVRDLARKGIIVIGHMADAADGAIAISPNANQILSEADQSFADFIVACRNLDAHDAIGGDNAGPMGAASPLDEISSLDLKRADIGSIVWATGYRFAYDWLQLPVLAPDGTPVQTRGVTACSGVYFLGLHWMHTFGSGLLPFVARDANYIADHIDRLAA